MVVMGIALKVVIGLVLILPMTAYVVGSLVAAAEEPREHTPIIVQEQPTRSPGKASTSPSAKPTEKPTEKPSERGHDRGDDDPSDDDTPEVITPSPDDLFDDHGGDDGDDNSGKGSDDD